MKGIILAGGSGTRLSPLTKFTSKQLLPVYNKPMIYYPIETLKKAGIRDILIIIAPHHAGNFLNLLGSGKELGVNIAYEIQDHPDGLAQAFLIGESFIGNDDTVLILGDNLFTDDFSGFMKNFSGGAQVFAKKVPHPERFGVIEFDSTGKAISIEEKPKKPKSDFAQVGLYICDNSVIKKAKNIGPSARGELEITSVINEYLKEGSLKVAKVEGAWFDCGTHESLFEAGAYMRNMVRG
jgi:glucose-1-phosphate thymidylyltransferase